MNRRNDGCRSSHAILFHKLRKCFAKRCHLLGRKKVPRTKVIVYYGGMSKPLNLSLDRTAKISSGGADPKGGDHGHRGWSAGARRALAFMAGSRCPAWCRARHRADCVREAGCRPVDRGLAATGTRVAQRPRAVVKTEPPPDAGSFMRIYQEMTQGPALFKMGIPATETFPATLFARIRAHAVRAEASAHLLIPILAASSN